MALLRRDKLFEIHVAGGRRGKLLYNGGHGGTNPTSARAFRTWALAEADVRTFAAMVQQAIADHVAVQAVRCSSQFFLQGTKQVGKWTAGASLSMSKHAPFNAEVQLTIAPGSEVSPRVTSAPQVAPDCPAVVKEAVLAPT